MDRDKRGGHNRKKVNEDFFKKWSPQMAYVLGFIYADGTVEDCRESSRTCYLGLCNNDIDILKDIMDTMSTQQTIQIRGPHIMKINGKEYFCKNNNYYVRIGNKVIYGDLILLGLCPRKSLVVELPEMPEQYFQYFLRGYFDGDGCIHIEKTRRRLKVIFTSGSKIFLEQLGLKIGSLVEDVNFGIYFNHGAYKLTYSGKNALMIANFIYQDVTQAPHLKYKYEKYKKYLDETKELTPA